MKCYYISTILKMKQINVTTYISSKMTFNTSEVTVSEATVMSNKY